MIHDVETVERIRKLLKNAGVPEGEAFEEMVDHYLSDLEAQIELNDNPSLANAAILQKIEKTDFRFLQQKKKSSIHLLLTAIFISAVSFFVYQNHFIASPVITGVSNNEKIPDGWPLEESMTRITSNFGMRIHPILNSPKLHQGIDIKAKIGTPVLATADAVVAATGFSKMAGKYIILKHNPRYSSRYNHLSSIDVQQNEVVAKGSLIGKVGDTGASRGPHLHYEILDGKTYLDPLEYARP